MPVRTLAQKPKVKSQFSQQSNIKNTKKSSNASKKSERSFSSSSSSSFGTDEELSNCDPRGDYEEPPKKGNLTF